MDLFTCYNTSYSYKYVIQYSHHCLGCWNVSSNINNDYTDLS